MTNTINRHSLNKISDLSDFFNIIEIIGGGSFGTVYRAIHIRSDQTKALKIGSKYDSPHRTKFDQEINILSLVNHPNIISLEAVYESPKKICLVLEYCPRELAKVFREENFLNEITIQRIMQYLTSAVAYLHTNGIVHRDLKLENILIGENPTNPKDAWFVKVCDFSVSACKQGTGYDFMLNEFCGTPLYMAPEMQTKSYSEQCDVWALGVIMYLLFEGRFPFQIHNRHHIQEVIAKTNINFESLKCSKAAARLIETCLQMNPAHRITAQEMAHSAWITGNQFEEHKSALNVLQMMDEYNRSIGSVKSETKVRQKSIAGSETTRTTILGGLPETSIKQVPIERQCAVDYPKITITTVTKGSDTSCHNYLNLTNGMFSR